MTKMIAPKVNEIKEKFKDNEELVRKRTMQLYNIFNIDLVGGCLPLLVQLPIIFTLFYCWRRLAAEKFEHYSDSWLWVPSLSQPNPDFSFNLDWLLQFDDAGPLIGWNIWIRQLILPAIVVAVVLFKNLDSSAAEVKEEEKPNPIAKNFPVLLTLWITLELPQVMSVYYLAFNLVGLLEVELVKIQIRKEMPVFEVFERTGQFPEGNFDEVFFPESLHKAALKGNVRGVQTLISEGNDVDELDESQNSPLGYAAGAGHLPVVAQLCLAKANMLIKDSQDNTVLHFAAAYDHADVLKYLIAHGRAMHATEFEDDKWREWKNKNGLTVVDIVRANEQGKIMRLLGDEFGFRQELVEATADHPSAVTPSRQEPESVTSSSGASRARSVD
eukprot:TRINITY_DN31811_c0_g1_i2.p1 TRINITY_DN31811_c0_g1~~TRINITY_DN31811_c0_g1_i2.p1  ORF type:complete len:386 (-),score=63.69 TRINITY_DN31811_c0_g1_i2:53-1210(-)